MQVCNSSIGSRVSSDHAPVIIEWAITGQGMRRQTWRLDYYLLLNQEVKTYIQKEIALVLFFLQIVR